MPDTNFTSGAWSNRKAAFLRWIARHQLPCLAVACCAAVFAADGSFVIGSLVFLLSVSCLAACSRRFALIAIFLSCLCGSFHYLRLQELNRQHTLIESGVLMEFRAKIAEEPRLFDRSWQCHANVLYSSPLPHASKKILLSGTGAPPSLGQEIDLHGRWEAIAEPRNRGEFDRAGHLRRLGIVAECFVREWHPTDKPIHPFWTLTKKARDGFRHSITHGIPLDSNEAKVILAMVMGQQPPYQDPVVDPFRQSGTLHLFSVSGQHVNLVAAILWLAMRLLRVPRRYSILLLIPAVFGYAWLTGASPPAVRAAWMAAVFLSAFLVQRKANLMQALSAVILVALFLDSNLLFLAGVQLSYGIVAVISIGLAISRKLLETMSWNDSYLPRELYTPAQIRLGESWKKLWQSLIISASACIGSAPLTIRYFSMITPISIISNLVLTPLVAGLLGLALFSAAVAPLSETLSQTCNRMNAYLARGCIHTTQFFAKIPGSHAVVSFNRPANDAIHIYDLPRGGSAILVQCKKSDVLYDCGNERAFRSIILPSLGYLGSQPKTLILSHPEAAHIGGGMSAIQQFPLQQIIAPVPSARSTSFRKVQQTAEESKVPFLCAQPNIRWQQDDQVEWEILQTPDPNEKNEIADNRVALYLLHFHGYRMLIAQDAGALAMQQLHRTHPQLRCDVIVTGKHSLHPPQIDDLIANTGARVVIASHATFPETERIPDDWQTSLTSRGVTLFHQGKTGMITLSLQKNDSLNIAGFVNNQTFTLHPAK